MHSWQNNTFLKNSKECEFTYKCLSTWSFIINLKKNVRCIAMNIFYEQLPNYIKKIKEFINIYCSYIFNKYYKASYYMHTV